jgi:hypothetical protein
LTLSITDAQGRTVRALKNNDQGWPVLDAETGAVTNPLTVKVTMHKQSDADTALAISFGSPDATTRFYPTIDPEPDRCAIQESFPDNAVTIFSYRRFLVGCDLRLLATGATQSFSWRVWIQPSSDGPFDVEAKISNELTGTAIDVEHAEVSVPQANIRPVVFVPGFLGSYPDHHGGTKVVVDPIAGTYEGLITELQVLGYELNNSLILAPYKWYGEIRGTSEADKNDMPAVAIKLKDKLTQWWEDHTAVPYIRQDRFDVVTHSTGGPVVRYYATELGDDDKLNTVIFVAAPQQGSTKAYSVWEGIDPPNTPGFGGYLQDRVLMNIVTALAKKAGCYHAYGILNSYQWVTSEDLYRYVQGQDCVTYTRWLGIDSPSSPIPQPGIPLLHDLLPSAGAQEQYPYLYRDGNALHSFGPTSPALNVINSPNDVNKFIDAITDHDGALYSVYSIDKRTDKTKTVKWYDIETDPQVTPLWMNGRAKPVGWPGRLIRRDSSNQKSILRTNQAGYIMAQDGDLDPVWGDGTVSGYSGDLTQLVNDSRIHSIPMDNVEHGEFFNAEESLRQIVAPLLDPKKPESVQSILPYIPPSLPSDFEKGRRAVWWNECPVTMLITDPQGRQIGTTPDGQEVNEIPGGYYSGHSVDNEPDVITFPDPASGVYTVTITGVATDTFQIRGEVQSATESTRLGSFSGQLQPGQVVTYRTAPFVPDASPRLLLVDDHAGPAVTAIYRDSLAQLGRTPDIWDVAEKGLPDLNALYPYDTTIWTTGTAGTMNLTTSLTLEAYTYNGGMVLLSGQDVDEGISDTITLSETLRARLIDPAVDGRTLQGQSLFAGLTLHLNGGDSANNQDSPVQSLH